ncbi:MAG: hypothetical protein WKF83_14045 [Nocardioidaceae bacterium]
MLLVVHGADPVVNGEDADRTPVAALGGMVVPAVCFVLINSRAGGGALKAGPSRPRRTSRSRWPSWR